MALVLKQESKFVSMGDLKQVWEVDKVVDTSHEVSV